MGIDETRRSNRLGAGPRDEAVASDDRIAPETGAITRERASAFRGTHLQQFLTPNRIGTVMGTGVTGRLRAPHRARRGGGAQMVETSHDPDWWIARREEIEAAARSAG